MARTNTVVFAQKPIKFGLWCTVCKMYAGDAAHVYSPVRVNMNFT